MHSTHKYKQLEIKFCNIQFIIKFCNIQFIISQKYTKPLVCNSPQSYSSQYHKHSCRGGWQVAMKWWQGSDLDILYNHIALIQAFFSHTYQRNVYVAKSKSSLTSWQCGDSLLTACLSRQVIDLRGTCGCQTCRVKKEA